MRKPMDLPFYNGAPVAISAGGWLLVMTATVLGFAALFVPLPLFRSFPFNFIPPLLFVCTPLAALAIVTRGRIDPLFRNYGFKGLGLSLLFAAMTTLAPLALTLLLSPFVVFTPNPSSDILAGTDASGLAIFLSRTFIQLLGEELVTILPLLAVLWLCVHQLKLPRTVGLIIAVLISTAWFSAMHLSTYDWNIVQCFAVIGSARLVLTMSYLITRNLWVSFVAHLINDWSIFVFVFSSSHMPADV